MLLRLILRLSLLVFVLIIVVASAARLVGQKLPPTQRIAYVAAGSTARYSVNLIDVGRRLRVPFAQYATRVSTPVWSPDGQSLLYRVYSSFTNTLVIADLRTRSDTEQVPFEHEALERDALCLKGDVLELLGRRLESIAAAPLGQPSDWLEARKRLEDALVAYERLERLYGLSYLCAWGLAQRIEILRLLGVRAAVDRQRAQELLDGAERTLERIPQSQWAQAPRSMGKTYWEQWFRWYRQSRALER